MKNPGRRIATLAAIGVGLVILSLALTSWVLTRLDARAYKLQEQFRSTGGLSVGEIQTSLGPPILATPGWDISFADFTWSWFGRVYILNADVDGSGNVRRLEVILQH